MRFGQVVLFTTLIAGCLVLGLSVVTGCRSEQRTTGVEATQTTDDRGTEADAMAGSDADRARADLDRQDQQKRNRRPAAPPARSGSRAIDQPRSGTPRP